MKVYKANDLHTQTLTPALPQIYTAFGKNFVKFRIICVFLYFSLSDFKKILSFFQNKVMNGSESENISIFGKFLHVIDISTVEVQSSS